MTNNFKLTFRGINKRRTAHRWLFINTSKPSRHVAEQQKGNFASVIYKLRSTLCVGCGALLLLASCGTPSGGGSVPSSNTSTGTNTQGPVSIATDHSIYQGNQQIHATVHNTLPRAIYAFDTRASCSILDLEINYNGTWQEASTARCSLGRPAMLVTITPSGSYNALIRADQPGINKDAFPPGTYRLVLRYTENSKAHTSSPTLSVTSAPLTITGSGGSSTLPTPSTTSSTPVKVNPPPAP